MRRTYLDHNATAPVLPEVATAVADALQFANPSSVHAEGRVARAAIEKARICVARLIGALPRDVVFTSGGTEANATVLASGLGTDGRSGVSTLLLMSATEHPCVGEGHGFAPDLAERIPVGRDGVVDVTWLEARLVRLSSAFPDGRALISVHFANNETGVIQPVRAICDLARRFEALVHVDAVQAAGRIDVNIAACGADVMTLSAHKLGGPKGVGAIVFRDGRVDLAERLLRGGGQEHGRRAGTENVAGIVGFGVAAKHAADALREEQVRLCALRDNLEQRLLACAPDTIIFGRNTPRLPNTSAFATPGVKAETALIQLDLAGVSVSSGAACSSGKVKRSHVLEAMSVPPHLSEAALRVSLGWTTISADIDCFIAAYQKVLSSGTCRHDLAAA